MANPFENALSQIKRANAVQEFDADFLKKLIEPENVIDTSVDVTMDDGSTRAFDAYRVQFNSARGPYKGGIRFHHETDLNEVKALAFWMALKTAVVNIPMGGGKGGVNVNPKELSEKELEGLARAWVRAMADHIGPEKDVPAPDVGTTPQIMAWMADEFGKVTGDTSGAVVTGKPLDKGGSEGRNKATAMGGFYVFKALQEKLELPAECSVVVQGFGNAGQFAAELWSDDGHKVVAVSDSRSGVYNPDGLDVAALMKHKKETGAVKGFEGVQEVSNDELLELTCDLLIPAALENQITKENAANIKAKVVLELANGPTTPEADDVLFASGIHVLPDILANAGGVTVSTFEWEQNRKGENWSEEDVLAKLKEIMDREAVNVFEKAESLDTDMRRAAFIIALERLKAAM